MATYHRHALVVSTFIHIFNHRNSSIAFSEYILVINSMYLLINQFQR